jgi:hypothetical protein
MANKQISEKTGQETRPSSIELLILGGQNFRKFGNTALDPMLSSR